MASLSDALAYLVLHVSGEEGISVSRLSKLLYLADWRAEITQRSRPSRVEWAHGVQGPWSKEIQNLVRKDNKHFSFSEETAGRGKKTMVHLAADCPSPILSPEEQQVLDFVIDRAGLLSWADFTSLVYSTYPVVKTVPQSALDLRVLASEYLKELSTQNKVVEPYPPKSVDSHQTFDE